MVRLGRENDLHAYVQRYGSPLNVLAVEPFARNLLSLNRAAADAALDFRVFFARKANKCLGFVDVVNQLGAGVDTASRCELQQTLDRGVDAARIICTAAIKDADLLRLCLASGVTIAVDNSDELAGIDAVARETGSSAKVALRISGFAYQGTRLDSRFGFDIEDLPGVVQRFWHHPAAAWLQLDGIHFHLDGYSHAQRAAAITQSLTLIDKLRPFGHQISFLDMGGGIPVSYLESEQQWERFWESHCQALLGQRASMTYRNHGLGLIAVNGEIHRQPNCYPSYQEPVQADWLARVLSAPFAGKTIAAGIRSRGLQLRCEPGRSLLDGCGITAARVEYRKKHPSGYWLIGLAMNRTQCRTTHDEFMVDPLLLRSDECGPRSMDFSEQAIEGYLVGAYCTECEVLLQRKLRFPKGVRIGDLIIFPNTAGYLMHFMESRSHQFPLAKNIFVPREFGAPPIVDEIDGGS